MSPLKARAIHVEGTRVWFLDESGTLVSLDVKNPQTPVASSPVRLSLPWKGANTLAVGPRLVLAVKDGQAVVVERASGQTRKHLLGPQVDVVASWCAATQCFAAVLSGPDFIRRSLRLHTLSLKASQVVTVASIAGSARLAWTRGSKRWLAWWADDQPGVSARRVLVNGTLGASSALTPKIAMARLGPGAEGLVGVDKQHRVFTTGLRTSKPMEVVFGPRPPAGNSKRSFGRNYGVDEVSAATNAEGTLFVGTRNFSRGRRPGFGRHNYWSAAVFRPTSGKTKPPQLLESESGRGLAGLTAQALAGPNAFAVAFERRDGETSTSRWSLWQLRGPCP